MRIAYVFADNPQEWNCSQYLAIDPMNAINKTGVHSAQSMHTSTFVENSEETQKIISESDIILIERNLFQDCLTLLMFWKVRGKSIAIMFDDGYSVMHPKNVSYGFWTNGEVKFKDEQGVEQVTFMNPKPLQQLGWGIQMSKGLQVVSQALVDDWKHLNDGYIINHHIVTDKYMGVKPLHPHEDIFLGWSGSLSHVDSFESSGILKAFQEIIKKYPKVKILLTGERRIFDILDVPADKKMYSNFVPAEQYPALVKTFDIYVIPLAGEYDKRRSQIKPIECEILKVPYLATEFPNYSHLKPYGNFTDNGWENWFNNLCEMIDHLPTYKEKAIEVGYPHGLTQNIDLHVQERIDLYQKLIDKPYR